MAPPDCFIFLMNVQAWAMFGARAIKRRRDKEAELKVLSSNTNSFTSNTNSKIKQNQIQIHSHYVEIKNAFTSNTNSHKSYIQSLKCCGQTAHSSVINAIHWWNQKDRHSAVAITRTNFIITNVVITRNFYRILTELQTAQLANKPEEPQEHWKRRLNQSW